MSVSAGRKPGLQISPTSERVRFYEKKITILVLYTRRKPEIKYSGEIMEKETQTLENFGYRSLITLGSQPSKSWRTAAP
jgi:hypothetical protein